MTVGAMPGGEPISCPVCDQVISMTLQATLRAADLGVAVECAECGESWVYYFSEGPQFGPIHSPRTASTRWG